MIPILFSVQFSALIYLCALALVYAVTPSRDDHRRAVRDYVQRHLCKQRSRRMNNQTTTATTTTAKTTTNDLPALVALCDY